MLVRDKHSSLLDSFVSYAKMITLQDQTPKNLLNLRMGPLDLKMFAQRGARTHDPEIKSLMLYRLS